MTHRLTLHNLHIQAGTRTLVQGVDLTVASGELVALIGASGAGKSLTGRALVGMVPFEPGVVDGTVTWTRPDAPDITVSPGPNRTRALAQLRGKGVAWIPQDARAALVPVDTVHRQVRAALRHAGRPHTPAHCAAELSAVGFANPTTVLRQYPHTLSGGMARRVQVALALALGAAFLMADEPTTGLDRPVQARLLQTLAAIRDRGTGILLITHDLHLVRRHTDRLIVLDQGKVVASGPPSVLDHHPHPAVARLRGEP